MNDDSNDDNRIAEKFDSQFRMAPRLRNHANRSSKPVVIEYRDEITGEIVKKVRMSRTKFDADAKQTFLNEYMKWGRMTESAHAAGVSTQTVRAALERDPEFAEAMLEAEGVYTDKLLRHQQNLVFEGIERRKYDAKGNLVEETREYPIRLVELELKAHDERYRDKREVKMEHRGGVLLAPAAVESIDDWESKFANAKDVTPEESQEQDEDD